MKTALRILIISLLALPSQAQLAPADPTRTPKVKEAKAKTSHRTVAVADTTQTEPTKEQKPMPKNHRRPARLPKAQPSEAQSSQA